jgi:hypothetical protein
LHHAIINRISYKFLIPKSCALRARRPDWGATPRPALHRE